MGRIALVATLGVALVTISLITGSQPASAQQATRLNATEALGQRVYAQHCGVCHTKPTITAPYYGPALSKDNVSAGTEVVREFVQQGTERMPGFRYSLEPREIDAVVQYLKTVSPPAEAATPARPASSRTNERELD
ncbi:MAG: c-type cytochrome [Gemmatimonas sp.]